MKFFKNLISQKKTSPEKTANATNAKELVQRDKANGKMNGKWVFQGLCDMRYKVDNKIIRDMEEVDRESFSWDEQVEIAFYPFSEGIRQSSPSRTNEIEQVFISMEDISYFDRLQIAFSNAFFLSKAGLAEMKNLAASDPDKDRGKLSNLTFSHQLAEISLALRIVSTIVYEITDSDYKLGKDSITIPIYAIKEYMAQNSFAEVSKLQKQ